MFCQVAFNVPLDRTFDYAVPEDLAPRVCAGMRVTAPFGRMLTTGLVVGVSEKSSFAKQTLIKEIRCVLDEKPLFGSDLFTLAHFMKRTWGGPIGQILFALVPPQAHFKLNNPCPLPQSPFSAPDISLSPAQTTVFESLSKRLCAGFHAILLCGSDEKAQTQIALRLAAKTLQTCGQALITLPDVLAAQNLAMELQTLFGAEYTACWHSKMPLSQKKRIFSRISAGQPCLVISVRSGALLPFKNLRLAVMLEEENDNYKQEENKPYFHLRDLLRQRCQQHEALFITASDTPSLESLHAAETGKSEKISLQASASAIPYKITQKKGEKSPFLSDFLLHQLQENLQHKHASLIILNRRGYSHAYYCLNCGAYAKCKKCGAILTREKKETGEEFLLCKKCGHKENMEQTCPQCQNKIFKSRGGGTQKIVAELNKLFPQARVWRLDSDTLKNKDGQGYAVRQALEVQEADIVVGTRQALDTALCRRITLAAVADADLELDSPDFRASEKFGQMLFKLQDRLAGRPNARLIIQTSAPDLYPFEALNASYETAAREELLARESFSYPPFVKISKVLLKSKDKTLLNAETARIMSAAAPYCLQTLGPIATGKKTDLYKKQYVLLKTSAENYISLIAALDTFKPSKNTECKLIADPYDFY